MTMNNMIKCSLLFKNSLIDFNFYTRHFCSFNRHIQSYNFIGDCNKRVQCIKFFNPPNVKRKTELPLTTQYYALHSNVTQNNEQKKPSLFQKLKQLTKDYWYIVIPVHIVTSIGWGAVFYLSSKNGIDFVRLMEALNFSEKYVDLLKNSNAGHWVIAYTMYKLFTPMRYTVTLAGTTMTVKYLNKWGYLKIRNSKKVK